ncbi:MAG: MaoC family dehydratase N-terminal domain-containing protein [Chloroflexota bacterium]|nr:MaoC family dehydratase N-terminal domain-containing protein [Chloroflexota bacterium]
MRSLTEGDEFVAPPWRIEASRVRDYLDAVGDALPIYGELGVAPPLMVAAQAMGVMLERLALPPGAIHMSQELEFPNLARAGEEATCAIKLARVSVRGGMRVLVAEFTVAGQGGRPLVTGKSTVMAPQEGGSP